MGSTRPHCLISRSTQSWTWEGLILPQLQQQQLQHVQGRQQQEMYWIVIAVASLPSDTNAPQHIPHVSTMRAPCAVVQNQLQTFLRRAVLMLCCRSKAGHAVDGSSDAPRKLQVTWHCVHATGTPYLVVGGSSGVTLSRIIILRCTH